MNADRDKFLSICHPEQSEGSSLILGDGYDLGFFSPLRMTSAGVSIRAFIRVIRGNFCGICR